MSDHLNLAGNEIYLNNRLVGSLLPDLWATLYDTVASLLECAGPDMIPADELEEALKQLEKEHEEAMQELQDKHDELETQLDERETETNELRAIIQDIQGEHGLKGVIEELRADIARQEAERERDREIIEKQAKTIRGYTLPKSARRVSRKSA